MKGTSCPPIPSCQHMRILNWAWAHKTRPSCCLSGFRRLVSLPLFSPHCRASVFASLRNGGRRPSADRESSHARHSSACVFISFVAKSSPSTLPPLQQTCPNGTFHTFPC